MSAVPERRPDAAGPSLPDDLEQVRRDVDDALSRFLGRALPRLVELHPALTPATDELHAFVTSGGKRLRPLFLCAGAVAAGADHRDVLGPALALELLHTCALLHDDVIDAAPTRRGRPTAHERFAAHHRDGSMRGDPVAFGEAVAILLGDLAFVHADEVFLDAAVPADRLLLGLRVFSTLREEVMAGQYLDVVAAHGRESSSELALEVASLKSGRYTIARPLQLGATLGGDPVLAQALFAVGEPLGVAFQLRDDLLGVFGTEDATGKSAASDLAEGKRTLLVTETLARLDDADRATFLGHLGSPTLDDGGVAVLRELISTSGGRRAVEDRIDDLTGQARERLAGLGLAEPAATWLDVLADAVTDRRS